MSPPLSKIKESIGYYVKQNKRLAADDRLRKSRGESAKNKKHIRENQKHIERLKQYYKQVITQTEVPKI